MELHPTPFPVKSQYMKPKSTKKISEAPKINSKSGLLQPREKRVFGTARNPNIPSKTAPKKPGKAKPSSGPPKESAKPSESTGSPPVSEAKNKSSEQNPARPKKKKSACFQANEVEIKNGSKFSSDAASVVEPRTPVRSPAVQAKARLSATPYKSAERCSKCRFDRLESSSYWLGQIRLAESVGKHFVSAAFFQLALDC